MYKTMPEIFEGGLLVFTITAGMLIILAIVTVC
jgi:hypothetical protein